MQKVNRDPNGASSPSEYDVKYVHLHLPNTEEPIDITQMVNYIEVFESIYSPFLTVNINITDTLSLNHVLPITGQEFIEVDVRGPDGETGIVRQSFYIYKLSERLKVGDKAYTYTLCCISPSAIVDMNIKVSQAITGQPSDIVKEKFGKGVLAINKEFYAHPTKNVVSYISNYWTPMQNIKYLCDRSVSRNNSAPSYLFYETKKQFNFVPLDELVKQDAAETLFDIPNMHSGGMAKELQIIHKLTVDSTFNYIDQLMNGAYGNRSLTIDPTKKTYEYAYYDFIESYTKFSRLNTLPFASVDAPRRINAVFRTITSPSTTIPNMPSTSSNEWFMPRLTEMAAIGTQEVTFDAVGRFTLCAGNVVNVVVPITNLYKNNYTVSTLKDSFDRTLSGRYLITSIRHLMTRERHTISVRATKESMLDTRG